jgi:hypothetical protein
MEYQLPSRCAVVAVAAVLFFLTIDSHAQERRQGDSCTVDFAGSLAFPKGEDGHNFENGWGLRAGGGVAVWRPRGRSDSYYATFNYMYEHSKATTAALEAAKTANPMELANPTSAHGAFSAVTFDPTVRYALNRRLSLYGVGGFGWFRRGVSFNGANPATLIQSHGVALDRLSSNSGVFDFGGGANVRIWKDRGARLFAEVRWYHGTAINSGTSLLPVSLGIRW